VIVGAPHLERVPAFEPGHDPVLIVHAHRVETSTVTCERVQPIPGRHVQVIEPRHGVDLIQFATHDGPEFARDAPSRLAVDAVPDVARRIIGQRPESLNSTIAHLACYRSAPRVGPSRRQGYSLRTGFNTVTHRYEATRIASTNTIRISETGGYDENTKQFELKSEYPLAGDTRHQRTVIQSASADTMMATSYLSFGTVPESKGVEIKYTRRTK
jgi:Protein of unknown function (DUF1579)